MLITTGPLQLLYQALLSVLRLSRVRVRVRWRVRRSLLLQQRRGGCKLISSHSSGIRQLTQFRSVKSARHSQKTANQLAHEACDRREAELRANPVQVPKNTQRVSSHRSAVPNRADVREFPCLKCAGEIVHFPGLVCWEAPNSVAGKCGDCVRKRGNCLPVCISLAIRWGLAG